MHIAERKTGRARQAEGDQALLGKKNVTIHSDDDLSFLQSHEGILQWKETADGVKLQIANEDISQEIFAMLQGKGFIRKFELEEPSLHDIFIEKVVSYE